MVDSDTIKVNLNGETVNVRYIGIDTPETIDPNRPAQYFGAKASSRNSELVEGQTVRLEKDTSDRDRFGRLLRYVYGGDVMVNEVLVREGFAVKSHCLPDTKYERRFHGAEQAAKDEGPGSGPMRSASEKSQGVARRPPIRRCPSQRLSRTSAITTRVGTPRGYPEPRRFRRPRGRPNVLAMASRYRRSVYVG